MSSLTDPKKSDFMNLCIYRADPIVLIVNGAVVDDIVGIPKETIPASLRPKVSEQCQICNGLGFERNSIEKCVRIIDEWEMHDNRTAIDECSYINDVCVRCDVALDFPQPALLEEPP